MHAHASYNRQEVETQVVLCKQHRCNLRAQCNTVFPAENSYQHTHSACGILHTLP
jgi:hypothetical protein